MSELVNTNNSRNFRKSLLASASGLTLLAAIIDSEPTAAADADKPTVWIELGGQFERNGNSDQVFAAPYVATANANGFGLPSDLQRPPKFSFGGESAISFEPSGTDWVFSVSARYGRSQVKRQYHKQDPLVPVHVHGILIDGYVAPRAGKFVDSLDSSAQTNTILDFSAGKDVGLGKFGSDGSSVFSLGVRFAQLTSRAQANDRADPDYYFPTNIKYPRHHHSYHSTFAAKRSFHGVGPSVSWKVSAAVAGDAEDGTLTVDWGINAAVLFGRQKAKTAHQTTAQYNCGGILGTQGARARCVEQPPMVYLASGGAYRSSYRHSGHANRQRFVTVPNAGGFAGLSVRWPNAKLAVGYRADMFFGAMDGGIDTVKKENRGFYGPFATISFGLGG